MAITKIHPIEKTLYLALDYIMNEDKTDEQILISSFACNPKTAHLEFEQTKRECNSKAEILARHLIQAFAPGETTPEQAHKIGLDLCERVLQGKYEYVLTTHIDKEHYEEYKPQLIAYETALKELKNSNYKSYDIKALADKYALLEQEKSKLMEEYSLEDTLLQKLQQAKKNTDIYLENSLEK